MTSSVFPAVSELRCEAFTLVFFFWLTVCYTSGGQRWEEHMRVTARPFLLHLKTALMTGACKNTQCQWQHFDILLHLSVFVFAKHCTWETVFLFWRRSFLQQNADAAETYSVSRNKEAVRLYLRCNSSRFYIKINAINQCVFTSTIMAVLSPDKIIRKLYCGSRI